jgi:hypothetical protein
VLSPDAPVAGPLEVTLRGFGLGAYIKHKNLIKLKFEIRNYICINDLYIYTNFINRLFLMIRPGESHSSTSYLVFPRPFFCPRCF